MNYESDMIDERPACFYTQAMLYDGDSYLIVRKETMENDLQMQRLDSAGAKTESWTEATGAENNFYYSVLIRLGDGIYFVGAMNTEDALLIHKLEQPEG